MTGNGKKQRRTNRTHAGVVLQKKRHRSGRVTWRARYTDPETGRVVYVSMDRLEMTNQEKREAWAADRSATTLGEIARMKAGKKKRQRIGIRKAVDEFFARKRHELRPRTVKCYEDTAETFLAWTDRAGLKLTIDLTPPVLTRFRAETISRPRCRPQRGGRQGKYAASDRKLAPATINRDLLQVRVILNELRRVGYLPDLDTDAIKDSLRNVMGQRPVPTFLRTPELRKLVEAASRHDRATFRMTRAEHAGDGEPGTTPRHAAISPFLLTVLLTGGRFSEVAGLRWQDVVLEADEILIGAEAMKTGHGRRIPLDVTPGLKAVLAALKLRSGGGKSVFGGKKPLARSAAEATRKRLVRTFGVSFS